MNNKSSINRLLSSFQSLKDAISKSTLINDALNKRNDNFLAIRIIAASMVIYAHAPAIAPAVNETDIFVLLGFGNYSGRIAVNIFFLISGFLVTGSLTRQNGDIIKFFKLRALRLVPAFFINLIILAIIIGPIATNLPINKYFSNPETWKYITQNIKFSTHMLWKLPGVLEEVQSTSPHASAINGSIWSIPAEVRMYLILGLLGLTGFFSSKRIATIGILILLIIGTFFPQYLPLHQTWIEPGAYFGIGVLVFLHRESIRVSWLLATGLVILAVITRHLPSYQAAFPLALSGIVFALAYITPPIQFLEKYGDPSYGVYLWGWPCQQLIAQKIPHAGLFSHTILSIALSVICGYASWHLIEKHVIKLK